MTCLNNLFKCSSIIDAGLAALLHMQQRQLPWTRLVTSSPRLLSEYSTASPLVIYPEVDLNSPVRIINHHRLYTSHPKMTSLMMLKNRRSMMASTGKPRNLPSWNAAQCHHFFPTLASNPFPTDESLQYFLKTNTGE